MSQQHRKWYGSWKSRLLWMTVLFLPMTVVASIIMTSGLLQKSGQTNGDLAPDITLATMEGDFHMSEQRGNVVVLYYSFPG